MFYRRLMHLQKIIIPLLNSFLSKQKHQQNENSQTNKIHYLHTVIICHSVSIVP